MTYKGKTITRHQRGNWFARVRWNGKTISIYGHTQIDCYDKLKIICDKIEIEKSQKFLQKVEHLITPQAKAEKKKSYTLKEWFDEWLQSYKVGTVRQATIHSFGQAFRYLQELHDLPLDQITNLQLCRMINSKVNCCRLKDKIRNLLMQMYSIAFNNRLVDRNPTLDLPRIKRIAKVEKKAFTQEQEKRFIDLCFADVDTYAPYIICCLQGLRKGEMLALRPNDFDFKHNTLRVDESFDENYPDDLLTKNQDSVRTMPMFDLTRKVLLRYANDNPNERLFTMTTAVLSKRLTDLLKENGLPRMTMHELRHTFISRCHERNIDEIIIQKWVGHAKGSRLTKAVYTHVTDDAELNYISRMNGGTK